MIVLHCCRQLCSNDRPVCALMMLWKMRGPVAIFRQRLSTKLQRLSYGNYAVMHIQVLPTPSAVAGSWLSLSQCLRPCKTAGSNQQLHAHGASTEQSIRNRRADSTGSAQTARCSTVQHGAPQPLALASWTP